MARLRIAAGSPANGRRIDQFHELPGGARISLVVRDDDLVPVRGDSIFRAADQVLILADPSAREAVTAAFTAATGDP